MAAAVGVVVPGGGAAGEGAEIVAHPPPAVGVEAGVVQPVLVL